MRKFIVILFLLTACTSAAPRRDFTVTLYKTDTQCVQWSKDGEVFESCVNDDNYPKKLIGIDAEDYAKERDYQDLLINECSKWKRKRRK